MVLQSNFAKNPDSENTPPAPKARRTLAERLHTSIHAAARRRRARTSGNAPTPKYLVEQAKRRSTTKSPPNSVRFNIASIPTTPPSTADVEMKDAPLASPSSLPSSSKPVMLVVPRELPRPEYCEISKAAIRAIDPELFDTPIEFIRDDLEELGPVFQQALATAKHGPIADALPKELLITVQNVATAPSHAFAVHSGSSSAAGPSKRRKVTLFPVHSLVFAAHCSKLPPFPPAVPAAGAEGEQEIKLPVGALCVPSPETFPQLSSYLYTKRLEPLLGSLFPSRPPPNLEDDASEKLRFARELGTTYTVRVLLQRIQAVHGLWKNTCALGIFDDDLWDMIDLAWEVLLTAFAVGTGSPQLMISPPPSHPESGSAEQSFA